MMLIKIFAAEILMGNLTLEQLPERLIPRVEEYIDKLTKLD